MSRSMTLAFVCVLFSFGVIYAQDGATIAPSFARDTFVERNLLTPTFGEPATPPLPAPRAADEAMGEYFLGLMDDWVWSVDPSIGNLEITEPPTLSPLMQQAVDLAPTWLQHPLAHRLFELSDTVAEELADLIVNPDDERYRDELAFMVAYSGKTDLEGLGANRALLLTDNVRLIYEYDEFLDYVEVIDFGDTKSGEYGTTLRYAILDDGVPDEYELPYEIYYWHVVHLKLDVESFDYIDPLTGQDEEPGAGGYFYREYLMDDVDGERSYHTPVYFQGVDAADLQNLTPSARGYLTDVTIHNIESAYETDTSHVVLAEFAYGAGQMFATTMRLEAAFTANGCPLLENLLNQGNGDILLPADAAIAMIADALVPEFQTALTNLGRWDDVTVISSATLAGYDEAAWTTFNSTYSKAIVPPNQPLALYQAVANAKTQLEAFVSGYRVLEMHLNTGDANDPAGLVFPGGFTTTTQPDHEIDAITLYGRPILADMLAGVTVLWDGVQTWLSGDRPLWDNPNAIAAVGNWTGKNMLDNIQERYDIGASVERSLQPVRIAYNHFGNCGELQDLGAAAMRTALIPASLISTINEDHVFNEFYFLDAWHPFQVDWSNGGNTINNPGIAYDKQYGGGKDISFVIFWLGDGRVESVPERFSDYITINVALTDADGRPVPDANIAIYSEGWMTSFKSQGLWLVTDGSGQASARLGENRNYFISIESGAGSYPAKGGKVGMTQIVEAADATAGAEFNFDHQFDLPLVQNEPMNIEAENDTYALHLVLGASDRYASARSIFSGLRAYYPMTPPAVDVFLVNDENLDLARDNEPFQAAQAWLGVASLDERIYPPDDQMWHLLVAHHTTPDSDHLLDIEVTAEGEPYVPPPDTDDDTADDDDDDDHGGGGDDDDDEGCGC